MSETPTVESVGTTRVLASWLGVLFVLVFVLNIAGGWVRLSGAGVAIPHWPLIEIGASRTLLPPVTTAGWDAVHAAYLDHQARLMERVERGELTRGNLGRVPADRAEFQGMFLTEWTHRLLAALVGVLAAGCLTTVLRRAEVRRLIGLPFSAACALIIFQAVLGGMLVAEGTNTRWLFLHQGNAGLIMACLLWSVLGLLRQTGPIAVVPQRTWLTAGLLVALVWTWTQLLSGALVSSSRHLVPSDLSVPLFAQTWVDEAGLAWNLLENPRLHQWAHRWSAWLLVGFLIVVYVLARRSACGERLRLALQVSATFVGVQIVLGLGSAMVGTHPLLALAHQAMGMALLLSLALALHDARHEEALEPHPSGSPDPVVA
jgi:cytochrome c oxidase assembly protein subunit 15